LATISPVKAKSSLERGKIFFIIHVVGVKKTANSFVDLWSVMFYAWEGSFSMIL
jgi:hypothetical protein